MASDDFLEDFVELGDYFGCNFRLQKVNTEVFINACLKFTNEYYLGVSLTVSHGHADIKSLYTV